MNRRKYITAACGASIATIAGCSKLAGKKTLSDPKIDPGPGGGTTMTFTDNNSEIAHLSVSKRVSPDRAHLPMEIWHRQGTKIKSIKLRVWMPEIATEFPAKVAVVSPVEGDSSPPPSLSLYTPERLPGTNIEVSDLDDLSDETISTLNLIIIPNSEKAVDIKIHGTIELSSSNILGSSYTLDGEMKLSYPELAND
ncbi:hypothetical protein [Halobacterium sp. BOL4-2]|uniref:hypothetical protein n=1 Tax=Halobacterium sp. BOL4-2 TaxID=2810537 RepID=UPI001E4FE57C|nr:hypothetical protein [Halobacterium sp. BOL4-2]UDF60580.1 hypothetical protein JRZ79_13580 [Halobacterium sp. BOL4-2]